MLLDTYNWTQSDLTLLSSISDGYKIVSEFTMAADAAPNTYFGMCMDIGGGGLCHTVKTSDVRREIAINGHQLRYYKGWNGWLQPTE